jgi:hypothetical protein
MTQILQPVDYLDEAQVLARFPLTKRELRRARRNNLIGHYAFAARVGGACYTAEQVQDYINRTYLRTATPCRDAATASSDSRSATITSPSPTPTTSASGTPAGMTPELAQRAGEVLRQQISRPRRSRLPLSSPPPPPPAAKPLRLIKS